MSLMKLYSATMYLQEPYRTTMAQHSEVQYMCSTCGHEHHVPLGLLSLLLCALSVTADCAKQEQIAQLLQELSTAWMAALWM
jgi:hypothetical protein